MKKIINTIITISYRDFTKFRRDRTRILATFIFPIVFVGILGGSLQSNLGEAAGYNLMIYIFTGVLGQTLFQSTASGIISLIEDRTNDFSQEMFISPVSRYSIILGKIIGETTVALTQAIGIIVFGLIIGVPFGFLDLFRILPALFVAALLGGAFGVLVLSNLSSERAANQIFPFVIFPQFFLSGVFGPIKNLPPVLSFLSLLSPMRYAVDFIRSFYYLGDPVYSEVVLFSPAKNIIIISILFVSFIFVGTYLFVSNEKNR